MKQKYSADDIKKIYEKSLPKVPQAPYREPVTLKREELKQSTKQTTQPKNDSFIDNITQPFKNIKSNYVVGDLGEKESKAWSAYRAKQDADTLKAAQKATAEREKYIRENQNVGQGNIVTKDFAQYLPQMKNQIVSGFSGAGNNAWKGAGVGAGAALIAGQVGPQVLAPEEIITVPAGAVAGAVMGGKAGYMEGVAKYSYNQMAGSAYKGLLDLGVPNDIALKVSGDEALISSLIEAAGAGVDIATVGISKLFSKAPKDAATKVAKNRLVSALKAYGVNIASEALEEGSQELVSIQSEKKALKQAGMPERDATWEDDLARILESARGGAAIATVSGGLNAAGNIATNTMYNNQIRNNLPKQETQQNVQKPSAKIKVEDIIKQNKDVMQDVNPQNINQQTNQQLVQQQLPKQPKVDGTKLPTVNANKQVEQTVDNVTNFAQNANSDVTGQIGQIDTQNIDNVVNTNTQQTKISPKHRNKFVKSVSDALGVSKYSDKAAINSLSDMVIDQIISDGDIDSQSMDNLFDTMMNEGIYVDNEFYQQYKGLKNEIRNTRLYVGDDIRSEFGKGEYNDFKKAHFGKLNLTSDRNDMSVDQYYQELSDSYPDLFPDSIITQQDQLGKIADVVNSIVKNEERLSSFVQGNDEYKQFARQEFNNAIENLKTEVKKTATRKLPVKNEQIVNTGNKNAQNLNSEVVERNTLPVKEKKSGILIDDSSEQYRKKSPHEYKYIDRLGKSVGVKVKFVPTYSFDVKLQDGTIQRNEANGYYDSKANTIVIAQDASNPVMVVAKHELTHLMQDRNPGLYKQYKEYVISSMKKKGTYQAEIDRLSKSYEGVLSKNDIKNIEDEIVSNVSAAYLEGDRQSIQEIIDYNPSIAAKVHEFIQDIIDKIKTALGKDTGTMNISQFRKAEKLWAEMLDDTIKDNDARVEAKTEQSDKGSKLSIKDNPYNEKSYHPFKETDKWEEQSNKRINWLTEKVEKNPTLKLNNQDGSQYALVTPSIKGSEYQITVFDKDDSPVMDLQRDTLKNVVEELDDLGFTYPEKAVALDSNKLKSVLLEKHNEYNKNKEALNLATEAIGDLQKVKFSLSSAGREVDRNRSGIRTIADGISREFINKGYVELKGRKIRSLEDLAVISQVFRDPRFETFRIFYTKKNKIVAHEAISSRIPGMTSAFLNIPKRKDFSDDFDFQMARGNWRNTKFDDMKDRMKRLKADGYYLLHNHPSGNPDASRADVSLTKDFMDNVNGFKGHVIINSNKYGWLEMGKHGYDVHVEDMAQQQIELFLKPTIEHPLLNESINGTDKAASIAKSLQLSEDKTAIVYTDVKGAIRGIEEIPNGMFNDRISIRGFLRNRGRHFGSGWAFLSTTSQDVFSKSTNLVKEKYLTDSILLDGSDVYSHRGDMGTIPDRNYNWAGIESDNIGSQRVNESEIEIEHHNYNTKYSLREKEPPKKTIKAYKLLRTKKSEPGKLYPLFVSANEETPINVWLDADEGEMVTDKKTGTQKVKSKLGNLAYRPGWHLGDIPLATHIGVKGESGNIEYMNPDHVWVEVEAAADINYQEEANNNGINPKTGKLNRARADIKKLPTDGFYRYKTNPNMTGEWIITGAMKINRVLSDSEAAEIVRKAGFEPLPRVDSEDVRYSAKDRLKPQQDDVKALMTNSGKKLSTKSQENIINEAAKRIQEAREIVDIDEDIADVLTSSKQNKLPVKNAAKNSWDAFKRKFVDSGNTVATVTKIAKDSSLYTIYNNARQSRQAAEFMIGAAQTDVMGNVVGESLRDIFDPIRKKGDDYYKKFSEYMYHMHNIDRMAQGKPVFGDSVTAEMSKVKVEELESSNPEFIKYSGKIYKYNNNLMQYRIDTGLVSMEQADIMAEMYPNYVPTYRKNAASTGSRANGGRVEITQGIKKAKGSSKDLLPLHEQMARQTMQTIQAGKRNLFGNRLLSDVLINRDKMSEYVQTIETEKTDIDIDADEMTMPELKNAFVIYTNGEKTTMKVNPGIFEGVKAISSTGREITSVEKFARSANSMFKKLVTAYNPMFTIKNVARDIQDAGLYTKDLKAFTKNYPKAWKEITINGRRWQQYQALGGFGSSVFDYEKGYKQDVRDTKVKKVAGFVKDQTYERVEAINFWTEQAPRFAEFLATLEKGDGSYENLMEAMYNSADVTVNFGRSGSWGKTINSTFVPFFNPAIQGTSKLVRQFTETKGAKNWTKLVIKVAALGIAPSLINSLIYDDDDEFDKIHDRDKDINFLYKIGEDQWVKIPKGRVLSLFGNAAQRTLRTAKGEENAWAGFISTAIDNTLPMNPLENNIYSPIQAVKSNTTWYGTPIEGQGLQGFKPGERYDTRTDSFSIWLGKRLNYSPKKINYLLDAYTGVIGDFMLPKMSQKAETNAFKKQFVLDSTMSNKISTTFYRKIDDLTYEKNSIEEANVNDVVYRFMNKQRTAASDLYREIKSIEKSNVSDDEKRVKVKEITAIINGIQLNALNALEEYEKAAEKNFKKYDNDVDNAYLFTNKEMFGAEYALKVYNKNIYQKYLESGQSAEEYFKEYFDELFAKREARAAKETSTDTKIKLPTIKTKTAGTKLPTIKNK